MSPAIVVGAVAGILCVVVLVVAIMILVLFCIRKKRQKFKVSTSELISPLENPVYQGTYVGLCNNVALMHVS